LSGRINVIAPLSRLNNHYQITVPLLEIRAPREHRAISIRTLNFAISAHLRARSLGIPSIVDDREEASE
jgi:hypothetical protein